MLFKCYCTAVIDEVKDPLPVNIDSVLSRKCEQLFDVIPQRLHKESRSQDLTKWTIFIFRSSADGTCVPGGGLSVRGYHHRCACLLCTFVAIPAYLAISKTNRKSKKGPPCKRAGPRMR
ncbi:unnamed protein product, partial [Ectocarpus sp. 12 AP-2014]